jgi:hypothetical protein
MLDEKGSFVPKLMRATVLYRGLIFGYTAVEGVFGNEDVGEGGGFVLRLWWIMIFSA